MKINKEGDELVAFIEEDASRKRIPAALATLLGATGIVASSAVIYGVAHEDITETPIGACVTVLGGAIGIAGIVGSLDLMRGAHTMSREATEHKASAKAIRVSDKPNEEVFKHYQKKARAMSAKTQAGRETVMIRKRPDGSAEISQRARRSKGLGE